MRGRESLITILTAVLCGVLRIGDCSAWVLPSPHSQRRRTTQRFSDIAISSSADGATDDDDEEEYEYVEYDMLQESDFIKSEWLIGTVMDGRANRIDETWVRLGVDPNSGKNVAIWGDKSEGTWNWDTATQFLSVSKEFFTGKRIWAGVVDDYYYMQGTIRGWNYWSAAEVVGQWQGKRLGIEKGEAGAAPWFETEDEEKSIEPSA